MLGDPGHGKKAGELGNALLNPARYNENKEFLTVTKNADERIRANQNQIAPFVNPQAVEVSDKNIEVALENHNKEEIIKTQAGEALKQQIYVQVAYQQLHSISSKDPVFDNQGK